MKPYEYKEVFGSNVAISSVDDEGDGGDRRIIDMPKPGAFKTYDMSTKKSKNKKTKDKYSSKYYESFKVWLENINSLDGKYNEILGVINNSIDYDSAVKSLVQKYKLNSVFFGDSKRKPNGKSISDQFYQILKSADMPAEAPPNFEKNYENLVQQLTSLQNVRHFVDHSNPWNFYIVNFKDGKPRQKSNYKMQFRFLPNELSKILDIAKIILDDKNKGLFNQFKIPFDIKSFLNRRDNFIIYLSVDAIKNIEFIKQLFGAYNYEMNQDFVFQDKFGKKFDRSYTDTKALELGHELTKKHPMYNPKNLSDIGFSQLADAAFLKSKDPALGHFMLDKMTQDSSTMPKTPLPSTPKDFQYYIYDSETFYTICNMDGAQCEETVPNKAGNLKIQKNLPQVIKQKLMNALNAAIQQNKAKQISYSQKS
jgi:hypothetical protein